MSPQPPRPTPSYHSPCDHPRPRSTDPRRLARRHGAADAEWFPNDIGSDYGTAALFPGRRRTAVLAATDTD
ncbi:DUF6183 family protein [Streptomyces sp. NPDC017936]|uniref:DUF6183 family protein n=1 Tax=Streptomyces sp. NPDC017936 TaxID=3365016 RepID=UPI00378E65F8